MRRIIFMVLSVLVIPPSAASAKGNGAGACFGMSHIQGLDAVDHGVPIFPLYGQEPTHMHAGRQHNVDPRLVMAIAFYATTYGKEAHGQDACLTKHNYWGAGGLKANQCLDLFSDSNGVWWVTAKLREYMMAGYTTIPALRDKWCCAAAPCSVHPECAQWESAVTAKYQQFGGGTADLTWGWSCCNDCNLDGEITVNELITATNIAQGVLPISACPKLEANGQPYITIDEQIIGVNTALGFLFKRGNGDMTPVPYEGCVEP